MTTGVDLMREYDMAEEPMADLMTWVFEHFDKASGKREAVLRHLIEEWRGHFDDDGWFAAAVPLTIGPSLIESGMFS